jgi:hypothetical protein
MALSVSRAPAIRTWCVSQRLAAAPAGACEAASFDGDRHRVGSLGSLDASFFDNYIFDSGAPLDSRQ